MDARSAALLGILGAMALPAGAEGYKCTFADECEAGGFCPEIEAELNDSAGAWALTLAGAPSPIQALELPDAATRHFVVAPIDIDADAVALLSIFADRNAYITTHGDFLAPRAFTLTGTCTQEGT